MNLLGRESDVAVSRSVSPIDPKPSHKIKDRVRSKTRLKSAKRVRSGFFTEDVIPLVLTSKTQEIFHCVIDQDVTDENPYKLIKKEDIINDMKTRGGISDFYPFKQQILEHSTDDFLIAFDKDFKYGQSFYMVINETMRDNILQSLELKYDVKQKKEEEEDEVFFRDFQIRDWIDLGSGVEIEQEKVVESPTKMKFKISRIRREFGAPVQFDDRNDLETKDSYIECTSYQDKNFSIKKLERDIGIQAVSILEENSTQTLWKYPQNASTQYTPSEFTEQKKDEILKSESLNTFINSVALRFEVALQQNEIMDVYYDDWRGLSEEDSTFGGKADCHLKEYQSFTDLQRSQGKRVSNIEWHPTILGVVAVSIVDRIIWEDRINLSSRSFRGHSHILLWNFTDPIHPQLMLVAPDDIYSFQFCPTDPNIVAGGCKNGQLVLWDISDFAERLQGNQPAKPDSVKSSLLPELDPAPHLEVPIAQYCGVSSIESGHKSVITDLCWIPDHFEVTKFGVPCETAEGACVQLITCSSDCSILFWDIRRPKARVLTRQERQKMEKELPNPEGVPNTFKHLDLYWRPIHKVELPKISSVGNYSPMKISMKEKCSDKIYEKAQFNFGKGKGEGADYGTVDIPSSRDLTSLTAINTTLFIGTEDGEVTSVDWQIEKDMDTGKMTTPRPTQCFMVHGGPVNTVQRSPFFADIILTIGGWTFAIWKEGVTLGPLLQSACATKRCLTGHWSLTRPGVIIIGKEDGNVDIWDLLEKTHEPSQTQNITSVPISCIKPWIISAKQHLLAVSDDFGTLHILEVPWALRHPLTQEKSNIEAYFDREVKRLEYFEAKNILRSGKEVEEEEEKAVVEAELKTAEQVEEELKKEYGLYLQKEKKIIVAQLGKA